MSGLGGIELTKPLIIDNIFDTTKYTANVLPRLVFWDPDKAEWSDAASTCSGVDVWYNMKEGHMVTRVCATYGIPIENSRTRVRRNVEQSYFQHETQFGIASVNNTIINNPPILVSPTVYTLPNDGVMLKTVLEVEDPEGDEVTVAIDRSRQGLEKGLANLSHSLVLTYVPEEGMMNYDTIPITLIDQPSSPGIQSEVVYANIIITIVNASRPPSMILFVDDDDYFLKARQTNITHVIEIPIEENNKHNVAYKDFEAVLIAYSMEREDKVDIDIRKSYTGTLRNGSESRVKPKLPPHIAIKSEDPDSCNWISIPITYTPSENFYGYDEFYVLAEDSKGQFSDSYTVRFAVLQNPCRNNATCSGGLSDPDCKDTRRAEGFDGYYCDCIPGWTGKYCDSDINECLSNTCEYPLTCQDEFNGFSCICPAEWPDCLSPALEPYAVGIIVAGIALVIIITVFTVYKLRQKMKVKPLADDSFDVDTSTPVKKISKKKMASSFRPLADQMADSSDLRQGCGKHGRTRRREDIEMSSFKGSRLRNYTKEL